MGAQNCKSFSCSKGYAPVQRKRGGLKFKSPGCDAMGGGAMMFTGGDSEEKPYESCCDQWHACFQICGTSRVFCDETFKKCVDSSCKATANENECQESAKITIMMLGMSPCQGFESAQNTACECVSKDNDAHLKKREEILSKFYRLYAPDAKAKPADLMKKAGDTSPKFANLLRQLVKKYPGCIEKIEDPQQAQMREMMKNVKKEKAEDGDSTVAEEEDNIDATSDEHQEL